MNKLSNTTKAHMGLLTANLIWAVNYPFYKIIMPHYITPLALVTMAVVVAGLAALVSLFFGTAEKIDRKDIWKFLGAALLMGIARKLMLMEGMQHTSPIDASIIATTGPIIVLIVSVLFAIDRFTSMKVIGISLGMAGAIFLIVSGGSSASGGEKLSGDLLVFLGVASSSFSMVWLKNLIVKYKPITILRWLYPLAALMVLPFGTDSIIHTDFSAMPLHVWFIILYVVLVPTFGPNYLLIYSLHYVKPTISSIYSYSQPVLAAALSIMLHIDTLNWKMIVSAVVVFAGVLFVVRSYKTTIESPVHHME